jgi:hypothetical protein
MPRGDTSLDSREYDEYLSKNKKEQELRSRHIERRNANTGYTGWHFGIDNKPVYTKDKQEFKRELEKRGLAIRDDVKRELR